MRALASLFAPIAFSLAANGAAMAQAPQPLRLGKAGEEPICWAIPVGAGRSAALTPAHCLRDGEMELSHEGAVKAKVKGVMAKSEAKDWALLRLDRQVQESPLLWESASEETIAAGWSGIALVRGKRIRLKATLASGSGAWARSAEPLCPGDSGALVLSAGDRLPAAIIVSGGARRDGDCYADQTLLRLSEIPWSYWLD